MPPESAAQDESGALRKQSIERIRALLTKALEIADHFNLSSEIGARIQEAIDALDDSPGTSKT